MENLRDESRRVLEKFLQQELRGRSIQSEEGQVGRQDGRGALDLSQPEEHPSQLDQHRQPSQESQFTSIRSPQESFPSLPERQSSNGVKSSQSTCGSYDGTQRREERSSQQTTSATRAGSLSSSTSDAERNGRSAKGKKRKKSLFRRAKERLERTLRRQAAEAASRKKKLALAIRGEGLSAEANVVASNSSGADSRLRLKFSQLEVSGPSRKREWKRSRPKVQDDQAGGSAVQSVGGTLSSFPTPPDSGRRTRKKRLKRENQDEVGNVGRDGSFRVGCSSVGWFKRNVVPRSKRVAESGKSTTSSRIGPRQPTGVEFLTLSSPSQFQDSTGIMHRAVGEMANQSATNGSVEIAIESPSSSSQPLSSPDKHPDQTSGRSLASSQEHRSSDDGMDDKYTLIARRLAELGDQFLSNQWTQLNSTESGPRQNVDRDEGQAQPVGRLSSVESKIAELIITGGEQIDQSVAQFQRNIALQLAWSDSAQQFGSILNMVTADRSADAATGWTQLAAIFQLTTAAVRLVGTGTSAARRVVDFCCDYITRRFSDWIVGQGGWSSIVEDQSSGEDDRRPKDA